MRSPLHLHQGIFRALHLVPVTSSKTWGRSVFVNSRNETIKTRSPIIYSFNGKEVTKQPSFVWTSSSNPLTFGNLTEGEDEEDCRSWTSESEEDLGSVVVIPTTTNNAILRSAESCSHRHILLCVEFLHLHQVNARHVRRGAGKMSFDKYLAILQNYDGLLLTKQEAG